MKKYIFLSFVFLMILSAQGMENIKEDTIAADKAFSMFMSENGFKADFVIDKETQKLGYKIIEYFRDGVKEDNAYLYSKKHDQFLILNIRYHPDQKFHFFNFNNIKIFFSHETNPTFLPDWDVEDINLVTLIKKVENNSYEEVMRLEIMLDFLKKQAYWRITSNTTKEYEESINFIKSLEKAVVDNQNQKAQ